MRPFAKPHLLTMHRRIGKQRAAQLARHKAGRYVWDPAIRRILDAIGATGDADVRATEAASDGKGSVAADSER